MLIGGLDLGTSGCKFTIYRNSKKLIEATRSYPATHKGRQHSINSEIVWKAVTEIIQEASQQIPGNDRVRAICVSSFGEAATPIDRNGNALAEARLFWDDSGSIQNEQLISSLGKSKLYSITGLLPNRKYTINKIAWFRDNEPEIYDRAEKFLLFEDFIIYRMTGECCISYSLAGRTCALDVHSLQWSAEIFNTVGIDMNKMSSLLPSGSIAGQVLPSVAASLNLDPRCIMVTGGHDQMCVTLGAGAIHPGRAVNGSGTVEALSSVLDPANTLNFQSACGYPFCVHADGKQYFTYGASSTGTVLLEWYIRTFGIKYMPEFQGVASIHKVLEDQAGSAPTNLLFLPYFEGAGLPFDDFNARGLFMGMTLSTSKQELYRALLESISYDMCINMKAQEKIGIYIEDIVATGGGSNSELWMQIKADVTGKPIKQLSTTQAGTQGCMILAGVAVGYYTSIEEAVAENVHIRRIFEPNMHYHHLYQEKLEQFTQLYHASKSVITPQSHFDLNDKEQHRFI